MEAAPLAPIAPTAVAPMVVLAKAPALAVHVPQPFQPKNYSWRHAAPAFVVSVSPLFAHCYLLSDAMPPNNSFKPTPLRGAA